MFVTVSTAPKEKADVKMSKNKKKKMKKKMKKQQQLLEQQRLQLEELGSGQVSAYTCTLVLVYHLRRAICLTSPFFVTILGSGCSLK